MGLHLWTFLKHHTIHKELAKLSKEELLVEQDEAQLFRDILHEEKDTANADQIEEQFEKVEQTLTSLTGGEFSDIQDADANIVLEHIRTYVGQLHGDESDTEEVVRNNELHVQSVLKVVEKEQYLVAKLKNQFSEQDRVVLVNELADRIDELHSLYSQEGQELLQMQKELLAPYKKILADIDALEPRLDLELHARKEDAALSDNASLRDDIDALGELLRKLHSATMKAASFNEATASAESVIRGIIKKLTSLVG